MERVMGYFLQVKYQPKINLQLKHMCMKTVKMQSSNHHDAKCPILKTKETDIGIIKLQMCKKKKKGEVSINCFIYSWLLYHYKCIIIIFKYVNLQSY